MIDFENAIYSAVDFLLTPLRKTFLFLENHKNWRVKIKFGGYDKNFFFYKNALRYSKLFPHSKITKIRSKRK